MRRSAPTSVEIGMMLDVGASVRKNQAARKPIADLRTSATIVTARSTATAMKEGATSANVTCAGSP